MNMNNTMNVSLLYILDQKRSDQERIYMYLIY